MSVVSRVLRRRPQGGEATQDPSTPPVEQQRHWQLMSQVQLRERVTLRGVVRSVSVTSAERRWLEVVLADQTGEITLVWMGRRELRGVEVGRRMEVRGLVTLFQRRRAIHNPHYTLLP
ncbi:OB-fold nucleic acid binding domain-containing protein [Luteococcus sp. OSA5]|uniref:OB-fold nucleic acid binding domain-containing protein n=1 Tax=Luteococcus sp. OSA5 TaxID=3401630 RepID=UPI003B42C3B8